MGSILEVNENLVLFEGLGTGDQIKFTDGNVWTCTLRGWGGETDMVVFVPLSLEQIKDGEWTGDYFFPQDVKSILFDAIKGGAEIIKFTPDVE